MTDGFKIGIVGLGLIGGSLALAIKKNTANTVLGYDTSENACALAQKSGAVDDIIALPQLNKCDIIITALYPEATVNFARENARHIKKDALLIDCCGTKSSVCSILPELARQHGFIFIGGHPMAGCEHSGFEHASCDLFRGASMILCPCEDTPPHALSTAEQLFMSFGFSFIKLSTPQEHDRIIAYTSQLAHIVSSAYVRSSSSLMHMGFSAGSFRDMTRVARLNEHMWCELFFENREQLLHETEELIENMHLFEASLRSYDKAKMLTLLREGRERKEILEDKVCAKN